MSLFAFRFLPLSVCISLPLSIILSNSFLRRSFSLYQLLLLTAFTSLTLISPLLYHPLPSLQVLVHNPAELPKVSNYGFVVSAGREARIPIEPVYEDATPSIRSIKKAVRRCLFSDENDLSYYRTYSRKNCELECEAKLLLRECSCVLYYLPRIDPAARVCGPNDNNCTNRVQTEIESSKTNLSCENCWPGCFELTYKSVMSSSTIVAGPSYQNGEQLPEHLFNTSRTGEVNELSILHFYYLTNNFRSTTKSEMFGFTEFLCESS